MRHLSSCGGIAVALVLAMLIGQPLTASTRVNPLAATLKQFQDHVDAYRQVRAQAVAGIGTLPKTSDPAVIAERQQQLAQAIRGARADAKQGDIFTPRVASVIRRFIARDLARRRPVDRRAFIVEQPDVHLRVNDFYPVATVPLATVPPRLLKQLPRLPDGLEYRFVGSTLILRDVDPILVVDLLPDAIPARYRKQ